MATTLLLLLLDERSCNSPCISALAASAWRVRVRKEEPELAKLRERAQPAAYRRSDLSYRALILVCGLRVLGAPGAQATIF